jgi:hypothetical protein
MTETAGSGKRSWFAALIRERSFQVAVLLWVLGSVAVFPLSGGKVPLNRPAFAKAPVTVQVIFPVVGLAFVFLQMWVTYLLTRKRVIPDLASRAPEASVARREVIFLWMYGAAVLLAGRWIGLRLFGERIGLHLNGSLFGATRMATPREVWIWAFYNFFLLAVVPFVVFRARGYSREALNLKSSNMRNDALVIVVIMLIGSGSGPVCWGFFEAVGPPDARRRCLDLRYALARHGIAGDGVYLRDSFSTLHQAGRVPRRRAAGWRYQLRGCAHL